METAKTAQSCAKSEATFKAAARLTPGGVNSTLYALDEVGRSPLYISRGNGAVVTDLDGNEYIDYLCSRGSLILGHADERVVVAIDKAASKGYSFGVPTEAEVKLAELVVSRLPSIDMIRLVDSATEAMVSVVRLARGFTGRDRIVTFEGCHHGPVDALLGGVRPGREKKEDLSLAGATADAWTVPFNDLARATDLFDREGSSIAAVLVEPVASRMGLVPPAEGLLAGLRKLCDKHGALLAYDETVTGFRVGPGGAAVRYEVLPDLVCFGSIVGGGLPFGALAGRGKIMSHSAAAGAVHQPGTLSGNPLAVAAGIATLQATAEDGFYEDLEATAARLEEGLQAAAADARVGACHTRVGTMLTMFFTDRKVTDWASARTCDTQRFAAYFQAMLERGVFLPPSQFECMFVSAAHSQEQIDRTIEAAHESLLAISR